MYCAWLVLAETPYLGYIIFGAVAGLMAAGIIFAVAYTLRGKKRSEPVAPIEKLLPDLTAHFDFVNELGFDPFADPAADPLTENSDQVVRTVELFRQSVTMQENCRRRIEILNYVYDMLKAQVKTAKDISAFLPAFVQSLAKDAGRVAPKKREKSNEQIMYTFIQRHSKAVGEQLSDVVARRETHMNDVAAAIESLRTRIITDEYVIFDRRSDLMALRPDTDEGRAEVELAKEFYGDAIRNSALMPLLVSVNRSFVDIGRIEITVGECESGYTDMLLKAQKRADAANAKDKPVSKRMRVMNLEKECTYRLRAAYFSACIASMMERKRAVVELYTQHKRSTDSFLKSERFSLNNIVFSEDRVIGQIAYEAARKRMLRRQKLAVEEFAEAERQYNDLLHRKTFYRKGAGRTDTPYDRRVQNALERVKLARAERAAADGDVETDLPHLNPIALIVSGSGVISKELLAAKANAPRTYDSYIADVLDSLQEYDQNRTVRNTGDPEPFFESSAPEPVIEPEDPPGENPEPEQDIGRYAIDREAMAQQLEEMERQAERALPPSRPAKTVDPESPEFIELVQRRVQALMRMRRSMKYINTPKEAAEFKRKLKQFEKGLTPEEKQNASLSELIRRTYKQTEYLGDKDMPDPMDPNESK